MKKQYYYFLVLLLASCAGISEESKIQMEMDKKAKMDSLFNDSLSPMESQEKFNDTLTMKLKPKVDSVKSKKTNQ